MNKAVTLVADGREFLPFNGTVPGLIERAVIRAERPYVKGWTATPPGFGPAAAIGVAIGGSLYRLDRFTLDEGPAAPVAWGFRFHARGIGRWQPQVPPGVLPELMLLSDTGLWARLPVADRLSGLAFCPTDTAQFAQHLQSPTTRLRDMETIAFHARRRMTAMADNPIEQAAALVVLAYRVLEKTPNTETLLEPCRRDAAALIQRLEGVAEPIALRWYLSLCLVSHHLAVMQGAAQPLQPLRAAVARWREVAGAPAQVAKTLKAVFVLGRALGRSGAAEEAEAVLSLAPEVMRLAVANWTLADFFAATALIQAASLTRACLVQREQLAFAARGVWRDATYRDTDGRELDCLHFPLKQFIAERRI